MVLQGPCDKSDLVGLVDPVVGPVTGAEPGPPASTELGQLSGQGTASVGEIDTGSQADQTHPELLDGMGGFFPPAITDRPMISSCWIFFRRYRDCGIAVESIEAL